MKVWVTKYAMSGKGVIPFNDVKMVSSSAKTVVTTNNGDTEMGVWHIHGDDWHTTPEAAIARAEEMRTKKIASLKKQIAKLEAMTFSAEDV